MDQFDKLIKEKAEKREFKYKPWFWILFAKQAGFMAFSAIQIATGVILISGLVGGGAYVTYKLSHKNKIEDPVEQVNTQINLVDTSSYISTEMMDQIDTIALPIETSISMDQNPQNKTPIKQSLNQENKQISHKNDTVLKPKVKPHNLYEGRRPLTINPDTILSND